MFTRNILLFAVLLILIAGSTVAAKDGFYIGGSMAYGSIEGDFNGESWYGAPGEVFLVPKIESDTGFGITIGGKSDNLGWRICYLQIDHEASYAGEKGEVTSKLTNIDVLGYFNKEPFQPYFALGLIFAGVNFKDGAESSYRVDNARYMGYGINLGLGAEFFINSNISLFGEVDWRYISFTSVEGAEGVRRQMDPPLNGSGPGGLVGLNIHF